MRELAIAYGSNRQAKKWVNKTTTFDALKERLKFTIRTPESAEEYAKMSKAQRDAAKDHGGFVAGALKGGRRKIGTVDFRSMVALDGDRIDKDFLENYEKNAVYTSVLYSTHSSTEDAPRVRLVFPCTRDMTPEEFVAVSRYVAQSLGIDFFDECSYQPNQLMYWPSTPQNGTYIYKETAGGWLDPDEILSAHPEWRDPTRLPTSSRESRANTTETRSVQDPLEKDGVVGLFNRVYFPVTKALDRFLADVYEPAANDRYHLIESSSIAGVEIKDDGRFVYSHHAKDPAYLKLCNAFDIVRIHLFGDDDEKKSFRDMCEFAIDIRYLPFSSRNHDVAFTKVADDRHFHPVRDYLDSLPEWDGVKRVEDLFIRYLHADDTEYVRTVTRKTFAAAVARIYVPGIKFDCVPVLDGDQGIGKSTIIKDLVTPDYYSETLSLTDMDDKSGAEKLQGFWAVEIGELAGMKKADIEKVKAFLSTCDDKYRPSYGKVVESHPRQCVIIATVNGERGYLRDITGNRRFWIIKLHQKKQKKTWNFDDAFRAQFWAEAKAIWKSGEKLYLEGDILDEAEKAQQSAMEVDERVGMVEEYLNKKLPADWDDMDLFARRNYLSGTEFGKPEYSDLRERTQVSNAEIWCECFGKNLQELKPSDSYGIAALMSQIPGWERTTAIRRQPIYGRQRIYQKTN